RLLQFVDRSNERIIAAQQPRSRPQYIAFERRALENDRPESIQRQLMEPDIGSGAPNQQIGRHDEYGRDHRHEVAQRLHLAWPSARRSRGRPPYSPVNVPRNLTIARISRSVSSRPSWLRAMILTASFRDAVLPS